MGIFDFILSKLKTSIGYQQSFEELVQAGNVTAALALMSNDELQQRAAIKEYNLETHPIMQRADKPIWDKDGHFKGWVKRWKLPLSYAKYINEIAVVFIYGRPVQWLQSSNGTDEAYKCFTDFMEQKHFDSKIRQAKRLAGSETKSALLFHTYQNKEGKADCLIKVLAKSLGDDIYYIKDQYDRLVYFARGYWLRERGGSSMYYVDIYTDNVIYKCRRANIGWEVEQEPNYIGKKPVILFEQEKEWEGGEQLMERQEYIKSRTADVNDYMADPALVATADVVQGLPEKDTENKLYVLSEKGKLEYLTPDSASDLKKQEMEDNEKHIFRETFTPNIDFDIMRSLSNVSGKALQQMMLLATIKANKRKETHDEYLTRTINLVKAILCNVTNIELHAQIEQLVIKHEYQEPFGEDITEAITNAIKEKNAGGMSAETLVELNPLIRDKQREKERIAAEEEKKRQEEELRTQSIFNQEYS